MTATATLPTLVDPSVDADDAVVVDRLTKRFGSRVAVDQVSFAVPSGTVAGLIGPNGAGKTTIMAMLLGLVRPTGGSATVLGSPVSRRTDYLPKVGALVEGPAFHPGVSGVDNLRSSPSSVDTRPAASTTSSISSGSRAAVATASARTRSG